jgi:DnaJ-class molecular chaperone
MAPVPITEDYYMVLEVVQTATPEQVIRSYKQLALKLHPDRNAERDTTEAFQLVCQCRGQASSFVDLQMVVC